MDPTSASTHRPSCLNQPADDATTAAAVCGAFYGCTQPAGAIEGLIASHVPRAHIVDVSDIYEKRWWDYRRLTPGHSFYLFAHCYYRASKIAARKSIAERTAHRSSGDMRNVHALHGAALVEMTAEGIWNRDQAHITGIWKAMLVADALGIPYPEYCRLACKVAMERLWSRLPRPSQLYSENLAVFVMDEWDALRRSKLIAAQHPIYAVENYDARPMQDAYRVYLLDQIKKVDKKAPALANAIWIRPQLPLEIATKHFPAPLIDRASNIAH